MPPAWPPPPDLHSIQELVREADIEGLIADGAPADEYDPEALSILRSVELLTTDQITVETLNPLIQSVWFGAFQGISGRETAIAGLAQQIARFFGPEAKPITRADLVP
jgi:hypothetical protein